MSVERFGAYAGAFEQAFESDDWSVVEPFFHEDATYTVGVPAIHDGTLEGRDAILAFFPHVLDGLDRRFATRAITLLEGPEMRDGAVWLRGRVDYTAPRAPDFGFELEEIARFDGDRIVHLEDRYSEATLAEMDAYLAAHGEALGIDL